ncbi:hypothetical protein CRYUN_Cryun04dG0023900 [Craigia yunnanensis]
MATNHSNNKTSYHARSYSLPSRSHLLTSEVDEHLSRLRTSEAASTSSSLSHKLNGLQDLQDCTDRLLQLPLDQQALAKEQQRKFVHEPLDGSLRLSGICSIAKDALSQTKEYTQEIQSILHRRRGAETRLAIEVKKYLNSRKTMKRAMRAEQAATISVLKSLLSFISGSETKSKSSRWSLVSKLMNIKRVRCEEGELHEIANAEATLLPLPVAR